MRNNRVTKLCNIAHKPHSLEQPRVRRIDIVPGKNGESEWNQQLCIFDEENIISRVHSLAHKATYLWSSLSAYFVHLTTANDSESGGWFSPSAQRNGIHEQKNKQFLKLTNDKAEEEEFVKMRVRRRRRRLRSWHCYQARVRRLTTRGMKCAATHSAKNVVVIVAAVTREHPVCFLGEQQHWIWMGRSVGRPPPTEKSRGWVGGMDAALSPGLSSKHRCVTWSLARASAIFGCSGARGCTGAACALARRANPFRLSPPPAEMCCCCCCWQGVGGPALRALFSCIFAGAAAFLRKVKAVARAGVDFWLVAARTLTADRPLSVLYFGDLKALP